ncbi:hypothetical protein [Streptomyces sp. NPDC048603]|uniref:hypothetical protein n=1 Tax=Streptomyces sp. NPDC048603 TaxID=3365577 RepID=UPI0037141C13
MPGPAQRNAENTDNALIPPVPPLVPTPRTPLPWAALLTPDGTRRASWAGGAHQTELLACGTTWDAVAIAPLEHGLAALDRLGLPLEAGYPVLADYVRRELIVLVPAGTARLCRAPGTRALGHGTWLLVPAGRHGAPSSAWLSEPDHRTPRLVDADRLRDALLEAAPDTPAPRAVPDRTMTPVERHP